MPPQRIFAQDQLAFGKILWKLKQSSFKYGKEYVTKPTMDSWVAQACRFLIYYWQRVMGTRKWRELVILSFTLTFWVGCEYELFHLCKCIGFSLNVFPKYNFYKTISAGPCIAYDKLSIETNSFRSIKITYYESSWKTLLIVFLIRFQSENALVCASLVNFLNFLTHIGQQKKQF